MQFAIIIEITYDCKPKIEPGILTAAVYTVTENYPRKNIFVQNNTMSYYISKKACQLFVNQWLLNSLKISSTNGKRGAQTLNDFMPRL